MNAYRNLKREEISTLEMNGCQAENWQTKFVTDQFDPQCIHRVTFYGTAHLGSCNGSIEVSDGFVKRCGIVNATLRNVTIGDNCLIENIGNFMNNVIIGNGCHISNVCTIETRPKANYGQGILISVLNEVGKGNLLLFDGLNSQLAALMVKQFGNKAFNKALNALVDKFINDKRPECSTIGNNVVITNTNEITNSVIGDGSMLLRRISKGLNFCSVMLLCMTPFLLLIKVLRDCSLLIRYSIASQNLLL